MPLEDDYSAKCSLDFKYRWYKVKELDNGLNWLPFWPSSASDPCASIIAPKCSTISNMEQMGITPLKEGHETHFQREKKKWKKDRNNLLLLLHWEKQQFPFNFISTPP